MKKFAKNLWDLTIERYRIHKSLRILAQQEWSIEFIVSMLRRAAHYYQTDLTMVFEDSKGHKIHIIASKKVDRLNDDGILTDEQVNLLSSDEQIKMFMELNK